MSKDYYGNVVKVMYKNVEEKYLNIAKQLKPLCVKMLSKEKITCTSNLRKKNIGDTFR